MATAAPTAPAPELRIREVAGIWLRHLTSLYIPGVTLAFLWTGPHPWYVALAFMWPLVVAHQVDCSGRHEERAPHKAIPAWPFDALVYTLAALQLWIVWETVQLFSVQSIFSMDMVMVFLLVGGSSGFSIITAHELIHRRGRFDQGLGRLLLCTVLYEHFYTEHLRGHHVRVGTPEDPATARFGESYEGFFRRTVPAQWRSAWRLEKRRLGDADMGLLDPRMLRHRMLHGLALEWGVAFAVWIAFGTAAFVAFLAQAFMAVRLLEAVNYFEHWGLVRTSPRVRPVDSWDTHTWFTYYGLVGLSRHADHHAWPARPYQQLRTWEEAPMLPYGYVGTIDLVMAQNQDFQAHAAEELAQRRLGPFAADGADAGAEPVSAEAARTRLAEAQPTPRSRRLPAAFTRIAIPALLLLGTALGVEYETGGSLGLGLRLLLHGWVLAALVAFLIVARKLRDKLDHESLAFAVGFAVLIALGVAGQSVLALL